jgi:hypothetical protein
MKVEKEVDLFIRPEEVMLLREGRRGNIRVFGIE